MKQTFTTYFSLFILAVLLWPTDAQAQDPRFSQFYASPSTLNPAMTGVFEGRWRFHANYRDQWSSVLGSKPFRTVAAGFDMRYNIVANDYLAFGVSGMYDQGGDADFTINRGQLSFAYLKQMNDGRYRNDDQFLIAGAQLGFGQHRVSNRLWFSSQYNQGTGFPDTGLPSQEPGIGDGDLTTDLYLDFSAGLMYYALFGDNASFYVGGAFNHLNEPNISLLGGDEKLGRRWIAHAGGEIPFTSELSLLPAAQVMQQLGSFETTLGANFRYSNHDWYEVAIRAGLWTRMTNTVGGKHFDALIVAAILEMERWNLGLSYDITTSSLTEANNARGAFEVSLIYFHPAYTREKVNCPKF